MHFKNKDYYHFLLDDIWPLVLLFVFADNYLSAKLPLSKTLKVI